jgi:hypothetical protein
MVQPINYTIPVADPFESLTRGMNLGLQMEKVQAVRQQRAMQAQQMQADMEVARQKAEQDAAKAAELVRLQEVPLEDMTQAQRFRLMELTQSEATRAHMARAYESLSTEQRANQARNSGSLIVALGSNPQVGIRRLQTMIEAEKDPAQKQALQVALQIAEINPLEAAKMIDGTLSMAGPEFSKVAESARNYLKNTGKPLYPEQEKLMTVGGAVFDPSTRQFMVPPRQSQLLSPEEEAQKARIAAAGRAPAQPREGDEAGREKVAFREVDAAGNVTLFNKFGDVIKSQAGAAKPSATFEKTTALRKQMSKDIDQAIYELTQATKPGGLIDQSTGSGVGRAIDVSAGFVGLSTPGAEAIARLQPIADIVLKMVPRFEGPQSDKDTKSYKEAAGQLAEPTLPTDTRKAAANEILRLMKARKGQFVNSDMAAEGIGPGAAPQTPAAGGTSVRVTAPNGQVLVFPNQQAADAFKKAAGIR